MKLPRYVLTPPVPGGNAFYSIADTKLNITVVSISERIPNAAGEARAIHSRLEERDQDEC